MITRYFNVLGYLCRDRISLIEGVIESVSFDAMGCVQGLLRPQGLDKDGDVHRGLWLDHKRLEIIGEHRLLDLPMFMDGAGLIPGAEQGPAAKPDIRR